MIEFAEFKCAISLRADYVVDSPAPGSIAPAAWRRTHVLMA